MRVLLVRRASTGAWLPRVGASETQAVGDFAAAVALETGLPAADLVAAAYLGVGAASFVSIQKSIASGLATPAAIVWPEGDPDAALVWDRATVDAVTEARVNRVYGTSMDRLARVERGLQATYAATHAAWPDGIAVTSLDMRSADDYWVEQRAIQARVDYAHSEGRAIKKTMGFE